MQLLHIKLRRLSHSAPQNRAPVVMHFQHVSLCFFARIAEDPLENHGHIAHQIHRIVMDYYLPRKIEIFFRTRLFFDRRLRRRYSSGLLVCDTTDLVDLCQASAVPPWLATHAEKANIRRLQFKRAVAGIGDAGSRRFVLPGSSIPAAVAQNFFLRSPHFARLSSRSIVESVQMQKAMDDVQLKLVHERVGEHGGVLFGGLDADKDFTVLKRQHVSRSCLTEKLSM
jgi:hypothetical protein